MKAKRDFTQGNPTRQLLLFSLPMIASLILQNLYGMADMIVVGRLVSEDALAAVGTTDSITMVVLMLISGATEGMAVVVSQFFGAKDELGVKKTVTTSLYLIVGLALVFSVVGMLFARPLLQLINVPANIIEDAVTYLTIIFAGSLATSMYNMAFSLSRAVGDSVTPMIVLIITSVLNVGFNLMFVAVFGLGVAGVAYGTVLSTVISAVVCWVILWRKMPVLHPTRETAKPDARIVRMVARIGVPSALQSSAMSFGTLILQSMINGYGSVVMAGFIAASKIERLISFPPGGITNSMQVFTGQNVGAGKFDRVRQGFRATVKIILVYSVFSTAAMLLFGRQLIGLFSGEKGGMVEVGYTYLVVISVSLGLFYCGIQHLLKCTLTGAGDSMVSMYVSVIDLGARIIAAVVLSQYFGYLGIFIGTPVGWLVSCLFGLVRYLRGKWTEKAIVRAKM